MKTISFSDKIGFLHTVYKTTGGAIHSDLFAPCPIYLQGDLGKVSYRNIILTPIVY